MMVDQLADPARRRAADVELRPIRPEDKQALVEGFERLSERSRYRRFLAPHGPLTDSELHYLTEVDHHDHEALVAVDRVTQQGVGVARYIRSSQDPHVAEVAVAVVDDWQGRGVGGRLTAALADRARAEGVTSFTALVLAENEPVLKVLEDLGPLREIHREQGALELAVDLPERGLGHLRRLLRAFARTELTALGYPRRSGHTSIGAPAQRRRPQPNREAREGQDDG
jgi:RimJ/RimL family protein N-acetyltransferase